MLLYEVQHSGDELLAVIHAVDFTYRNHLHNSMEFVFCMDGELTITVNTVPLALRAGEGALVPENTLHGYQTDRSCELCCMLVGRNILRDVAELVQMYVPERYTFSIDPVLQAMLAEFDEKEDQTLFEAKSILYRACLNFLKDNSLQIRDSSYMSQAARMMACIQENFREPLTLEEFAKKMDYNYFYVSKLIKQNFGISFSELLSEYRVACAKGMLEEQKYSISEIALASGFGSIRSFNRVFRRIVGKTPREFLKNGSIALQRGKRASQTTYKILPQS